MGILRLQSCLLAFVFSLFFSKVHANCYWPNGTDRNALLLQGDVYQPCNGGDEFSMCCATNRIPADKCRSDGLCQSTFDDNVWRDSCTDPYWKSPSCIKLCDRGIGHYLATDKLNLSNVDATVTPCGDGSYCCGNGTLAEECCNDKKGVFVIDGVTTDVNPSSTSKTALSTSSASGSASGSTSSSASSKSSSIVSPARVSTSSAPTSTVSAPSSTSSASSTSSNHTGVIVGGVIGGIGVMALLVLIALLLKRRRLNNQAGPYPSGPWNWQDKAQNLHEAPPYAVRNELDAREVGELDAGRVPHEMQ